VIATVLSAWIKPNNAPELITMTKDSGPSEASVIGLQPGSTRSARFDETSIMLHWITALLIVVQFASVWLHEAFSHQGSLAASLISLHRGAGSLVLIVVVARLIWRRYFAYLPPFPTSMPTAQQIAAKANEYGLYLLLLLMPVSGLGRAVFRGQPFGLFLWQVPALTAANPMLRHLFAQMHEVGATALMVLIGLHVGAALFHRLVLRDGVLQRMLPQMTVARKPTAALIADRRE
jgi:superoxide oxidase